MSNETSVLSIALLLTILPVSRQREVLVYELSPTIK